MELNRISAEKQGKAGIVVIGLNEASNLEQCLKSCIDQSDHLVYVDSGSTDQSLEIAARLQVPTIQLDNSIPTTAARGRNTGFDWLLQNYPDLKYVQFVDGDCKLVDDWIASGVNYLDDNSGVAIVYGHVCERNPEQSVYNLLIDIELSTQSGEVATSGGIFLTRVEAFQAVNGFRNDLAGGEEPEMCIRMLEGGWKLYKVNQNMALHDSDMHHVRQWWGRSVRDGHTMAEGVYLHGRTKYRHYLRDMLSAIAWAGALPLAVVVLSVVFGPGFLILLVLYLLQILRVALKGKRDRYTNFIWSCFLVVRKFPELLGVIRFFVRKWSVDKHTGLQ